MKRIPNWIAPLKGVRNGRLHFVTTDDYGIGTLTDAQFFAVNRVQIAYVVSIWLLYDYNTRDYAYEHGGMVIEAGGLGAFDITEWNRE